MSDSEIVYASVAGLGFAVLLLSVLFGGFDADADISSEIGTDVATEADSGFETPSWANLNVLASALCGFGIFGFAVDKTGAPLALVLLAAIAGMLGLGAATYQILRLMVRQQYNAVLSSSSYVGAMGELSVAIPHEGFGIVAFVDGNGIRQSCKARSDSEQSLPAHAHVIITDVTTDGVLVMLDPMFQVEE